MSQVYHGATVTLVRQRNDPQDLLERILKEVQIYFRGTRFGVKWGTMGVRRRRCLTLIFPSQQEARTVMAWVQANFDI